MFSELQGGVSLPGATASRVAGASPAGLPSQGQVADQAPKVQAPKPIDIKVDIEKLRANLSDSLEKLNQAMRDGGRNLNFHMDESIGGPVVLVKNADTGEVVRQIPNEVVVRIAHNIEAFKGMLHNELT
jgi:flagellar protein FlaG